MNVSVWRKELWNLARLLAVLSGLLTGVAVLLTASTLSVPVRGEALLPVTVGAGVAFMLGVVSLDLKGRLWWLTSPFEVVARALEVIALSGAGLAVPLMFSLFGFNH